MGGSTCVAQPGAAGVSDQVFSEPDPREGKGESGLMTRSQQGNLILRSLMEFGIVAGFGVWGYHTGQGLLLKIVLAVGVPLVGFGFWGAVDFHQLGAMGPKHAAGRCRAWW